MSEYNLNKLSAEQRRVYNMLYEAIGSRQETFNVDVVDIADVTRAYEAFSYDHPEIFYVDFYDNISPKGIFLIYIFDDFSIILFFGQAVNIFTFYTCK